MAASGGPSATCAVIFEQMRLLRTQIKQTPNGSTVFVLEDGLEFCLESGLEESVKKASGQVAQYRDATKRDLQNAALECEWALQKCLELSSGALSHGEWDVDTQSRIGREWANTVEKLYAVSCQLPMEPLSRAAALGRGAELHHLDEYAATHKSVSEVGGSRARLRKQQSTPLLSDRSSGHWSIQSYMRSMLKRNMASKVVPLTPKTTTSSARPSPSFSAIEPGPRTTLSIPETNSRTAATEARSAPLIPQQPALPARPSSSITGIGPGPRSTRSSPGRHERTDRMEASREPQVVLQDIPRDSKSGFGRSSNSTPTAGHSVFGTPPPKYEEIIDDGRYPALASANSSAKHLPSPSVPPAVNLNVYLNGYRQDEMTMQQYQSHHSNASHSLNGLPVTPYMQPQPSPAAFGPYVPPGAYGHIQGPLSVSPAPSQVSFKSSRWSLRETIANEVMDLMKPQATCMHGVRHHQMHARCLWSCCEYRGCI